MSLNSKIFVVNNIKLPPDASFKEAFSVAVSRLKKIGVKAKEEDCRIFRKSIDARRLGEIKCVYSVAVRAESKSVNTTYLEANGIQIDKYDAPQITIGTDELSAPPVIVGTGPCGLFCALLLAENGYKPVVLERGARISERCQTVENFNITHKLNVDTNIQFGAGGAGTFSDGKLVTRVNDSTSRYILSRFVEFGAPEEILYNAKPHIGTDILAGIVDKILDRIVSLGGKVLYKTKFEYPILSAGRVKAVATSSGTIDAGALIIAVGHSARDTYYNLMKTGVLFEPKAFSVGMRIEHLCEDIDRAMFGDASMASLLGHGEYTLSSNTKERGVYTFCMCPGGEVVGAASEEFGVVVNGMSKHARAGKNSNSAICCSIFKEDYGDKPELAIEYQRKIERDAYLSGGGGYRAPILTVGDFISGELKNEPKRILPTYMGGGNVKLASPEGYLPGFVTKAIRAAIVDFDRKIKGFAVKDAVLTGAETRTSAPVRIMRDNDTKTAIGYENIYPAGEGAGYAGGITSAAIDGVKIALSVIKKYKPFECV